MCTAYCYAGEPTLDERAALLVESLSLGVDAENTVTEAPTQSSTRSYFRSYFWPRGKRSHSYSRSLSRLSTNVTCPGDPANNPVCKDVCTATGEGTSGERACKPFVMALYIYRCTQIGYCSRHLHVFNKEQITLSEKLLTKCFTSIGTMA